MKRADWLCLFIVMLAGLALSLLPYLVAWPWFADSDELVALVLSSSSYHNHLFTLSDGVQVSSAPSLYPWLQMVPVAIVAKALSWGPEWIGLLWRIFAAISIPAAWYFLFRFILKNRLWSVFGTVLLLADIGYRGSLPIFRHAQIFFEIFLGGGEGRFLAFPELYLQWRLITPALSLAALLFHIWLTLRALERNTRPRVVWAGLSLALLVYTYFYFWTSAAVALTIGALFDRKRRRAYLQILILGLAVGAPSVLYGMWVKHQYPSDYLHRNDLFQPIERFSELLLPFKAYAFTFLFSIFVWRWERRLAYMMFLIWSSETIRV